MAKRRPSRTSRRRKKAAAAAYPTANIDRIPIHFQGWYLRTLRAESRGEYGKLKRMVELFLRQAGTGLAAQLWDRGVEVALEEALQNLGLRWGPKFRQPLSLDVRISDTHVKFSLTVPTSALPKRTKSLTGKQAQRRDAACERSLYVVRRLANRLHVGPAGRQLVFWHPVRREWEWRFKKRGRAG